MASVQLKSKRRKIKELPKSTHENVSDTREGVKMRTRSQNLLPLRQIIFYSETPMQSKI